MLKVRQTVPRNEIDVREYLMRQLKEREFRDTIKPGSRIAITVGSRGIIELASIVRLLADWVKSLGALPFIIPSMGSHGQATAEGQREVLAGYGISEETIGAPVLSSMEVVLLGVTEKGAPVYFDKHAYEADGIIVFNRIKPHTVLKGPIESGLFKMMAVGLGKEKGAATMHDFGLKETIPAAARMILDKAPILLGVAVVENALERPAHIEVIPSQAIEKREKELLTMAKSLLPRIPFPVLDLLLVEWMGKNISGSGLDSNIIGLLRRTGERITDDIDIKQIAILDLTAESHGNAIGIGFADYTTWRLFQKINFKETYKNAITSHFISGVKVPMAFETEKELWETSLRGFPGDGARVVRIASTLQIEEFYASASLLPDILQSGNLVMEEQPREERFNANGDFVERLGGKE